MNEQKDKKTKVKISVTIEELFSTKSNSKLFVFVDGVKVKCRFLNEEKNL